jgi:hypothetical protein
MVYPAAFSTNPAIPPQDDRPSNLIQTTSELLNGTSILNSSAEKQRHKEFKILVKATKKSLPQEIIAKILSFTPENAGAFILDEHEVKIFKLFKERRLLKLENENKLNDDEVLLTVKNSKSFRATMEAVNTKKIPLIDLGFTVNELKEFIIHASNLEHVDLRGYNPQLIDDEFIAHLLNHCKNIKTLQIPKCKITDLSMLEIASLENLVKLNVSDCKGITLTQAGEEGETSIDLPRSLAFLNLENCEGIKDLSLTNLPPNLLKLNLSYTPVQGSFSFPSYLTRLSLKGSSFVCSAQTVFPPSLIHLDLGFCNAEVECTCGFDTLPEGLEYLNLEEVLITDEMTQYIPDSVTHLNLDGSTLITENGLKNLPEKLKELKIKHFPFSDEDMALLPRGLRKLSIDAENITEAGLACLPPNLIDLKLHNLFIESNAALSLPKGLIVLKIVEGSFNSEFAAKLPQTLSILNIAGTEVDDTGLGLLPPSLLCLDLSGCQNITNSGINLLPRSITHLDVSECESLNDECLSFLPPNLIKLELDFCPGFKGTGFQDLPVTIRKLSLRGLADMEIEHTKKLPPNLIELELLGHQVTDDVLEFLPRSVENLSISLTDSLTDKGIQNLPTNLNSLKLSSVKGLANNCFEFMPKTLTSFWAWNCNLDENLLVQSELYQFLGKCSFTGN